MLGRARKTAVMLAMLLAITLAWAGHLASAFSGQTKPAPQGIQPMHEHMHAEEVSDQPFEAVFTDHGHDHSTPDHLHETPHLAPVVRLPPGPAGSGLLPSETLISPSAPVALIERPPRPAFGV